MDFADCALPDQPSPEQSVASPSFRPGEARALTIDTSQPRESGLAAVLRYLS
jgi:hypothetical protein